MLGEGPGRGACRGSRAPPAGPTCAPGPVMAHPPRGGDGRKRRRAGSDPPGLAARPRLDPDAAGYFRRAAESLRDGLEPGSERGLFVTNVLEEAVGSALPLAMDPSGSLLLQALLPEASPAQLAQLLCPLLPALRQAACHPCGAHVLEAALLRAPRLLGEEDAGALEELVLQLGGAVREELGAFARDPHASFVVRTLLQVLGGVRVGSHAARGFSGTGLPAPRKKRAKAESEGPSEFEVPDSFLALLREFIAAFQENIAEFITHRVASLCLQVALEVLHRKLLEACAELCSSVIGYLSSRNPSAGRSPLLVFLKDPVCSRVLDKVLEVSEGRALRALYRQHFRGQLRALAGHGVANFTLQRLIGAAPPKLLGKCGGAGPGLGRCWPRGTRAWPRRCWEPAGGAGPASRRRCSCSWRLSTAGSPPHGGQPAPLSSPPCCPMRCTMPRGRGRNRSPPWKNSRIPHLPWPRFPSTAPCCSSICCTSLTPPPCCAAWPPSPPVTWSPWPAVLPAATSMTPSWPAPPCPASPGARCCMGSRVTMCFWPATNMGAESWTPSGAGPPCRPRDRLPRN
ncbi:NOP9 nucleolar protein [Chelydra serpentina]|uniref:NOP9 nucleolar protein n=1 Tax=Chelydra serpentina TaxID=8475 RepID=A0A8T1RYJ5_CHESE|nr:NOP9 nucleolar protein [Chelydra serpentina]